MRRILRGSLAVVLVLASSPALAAPSARLVYVREAGAEGCADEAALRRAVAARLGYDPFFPWAKVTVLALVRKVAGGYHAEVSLVDEASVSRGQRALSHEGDTCAPLVGALALSISLALDPLSLTQSAPGKEEPSTSPPSPPLTTTTEAPPADVKPPPDHPAEGDAGSAAPGGSAPAPPVVAVVPPVLPPPAWHGWAGLAGVGSYGATPGVAFGGLVRGKLERGLFSVAVEAGASAPTSASAPTGGRVQAWLAEGTLVGCVRVPLVFGCGFVSGGALVAGGVGLATSRSAILGYGAAGPRLAVQVPLGERFRLEAFVQAAFAMVPRALQVDGMTVYSQPFAAGSLGIGASTRIF